MFWAGGLTYISYPLSASVCVWCRPWIYWALAMGPCPRVLVGMWHFGRLVCWIFFRCSSVIWSSVPFSCHFWGANFFSVKSLGVWDSNIAATRQQTKERLEKYRDIFKTQCYCVVACCYFVFFIFELQLWKKAGVLSFAWMLFYNFCCEWQILHLFGMKLNLVTTLLLLNLKNSCVNSVCSTKTYHALT